VDRPNQTFDVSRQQLELTWGQREPAHVVDRSPSVDEDDHAVLAVEYGIDLVMNAGDLVVELLP
jgi:hypothetical protein